jgi:hypothetical protein
MGAHNEAVRLYHSALSIAPEDGFAQRMLRVALQDDLETAEAQRAVKAMMAQVNAAAAANATVDRAPSVLPSTFPRPAAPAAAVRGPRRSGGSTGSMSSDVSPQAFNLLSSPMLATPINSGTAAAASASSAHHMSVANMSSLSGISMHYTRTMPMQMSTMQMQMTIPMSASASMAMQQMQSSSFLGSAPVLFETGSDEGDEDGDQEEGEVHHSGMDEGDDDGDGEGEGEGEADDAGGATRFSYSRDPHTGAIIRRALADDEGEGLEEMVEEDGDGVGLYDGYDDEDEEEDGVRTATRTSTGGVGTPVTATPPAPGPGFVRASAMMRGTPQSYMMGAILPASVSGFASHARGVGTQPVSSRAAAAAEAEALAAAELAAQDAEDEAALEAVYRFHGGNRSSNGAAATASGGGFDDADPSGDLDLAARLQAEELSAAYGYDVEEADMDFSEDQ